GPRRSFRGPAPTRAAPTSSLVGRLEFRVEVLLGEDAEGGGCEAGPGLALPQVAVEAAPFLERLQALRTFLVEGWVEVVELRLVVVDEVQKLLGGRVDDGGRARRA